MATAVAISVEEYLASSYRPDCDYVDGRIEERNLGELGHSELQSDIVFFLRSRFGSLGVRVYPELRVQVRADRFRVPDVCVTLGRPTEQVLTHPPFLCVEILSPEDRMSRVEARVADYLAMGVPYVWVLDPTTSACYMATSGSGLRVVLDDRLFTDNPHIELSPSELFA